MRSIIDITWGKPDYNAGTVSIPFSMHTTTDDDMSREEISPIVLETHTLQFLPATVAKGQASIEACINTIIEGLRDQFGPISLGKLREAAIAITRKYDLTPWVDQRWAQARPYHYSMQ